MHVSLSLQTVGAFLPQTWLWPDATRKGKGWEDAPSCGHPGPSKPLPSLQPRLRELTVPQPCLNPLWQEFLYASSAMKIGFTGPEGVRTVRTHVLSAVASAGDFPARCPVPRSRL